MGLRSVLACFAASFLSCAPAPSFARQVYTYEQAWPGGESMFHDFDMDRLLTWICRRDWKSIGCGAMDHISRCDLGRFCIRLYGESVPIIIPRDDETISAPGMRVTTTPFEFYYAPPCLKTRVVLENGDWTENISCGDAGIMSLKMKTANEDLDLFVRSWRGLGSEDAPK
jgi:hypothetical protein